MAWLWSGHSETVSCMNDFWALSQDHRKPGDSGCDNGRMCTLGESLRLIWGAEYARNSGRSSGWPGDGVLGSTHPTCTKGTHRPALSSMLHAWVSPYSLMDPFPSEAHPLFPLPWKGSLASWQGRGCKMGTFISLRSQPSILQDISLGGREGVALL